MRDYGEDTALTLEAVHLREAVDKHPDGYMHLVASVRGVPSVADALLAGTMKPPRGQVERLVFAMTACAKLQEMSRDLGQCYGGLGPDWSGPVMCGDLYSERHGGGEDRAPGRGGRGREGSTLARIEVKMAQELGEGEETDRDGGTDEGR